MNIIINITKVIKNILNCENEIFFKHIFII